jgi:hypothetical protein
MLLDTKEFKNWEILAMDENLTQNILRLNLILIARVAWRVA